METRKERDSLGEVVIPANVYWGGQTERSRQHFAIGSEKMPTKIIYALTLIKQAAAIANEKLGVLSPSKRDSICQACDAILSGKLDDQFPLSVWQTGSGTQTNMNVNEVISNYAIVQAGGILGSKDPIHPNDDVNRSQSSNDVFPTAIHLAATMSIEKELKKKLQILFQLLKEKEEEFADIIKVGRTHLMDATPITVGQEFSGYRAQLEQGMQALDEAVAAMRVLPLGGTAVGTGLNTPLGYDRLAVEILSQKTNLRFSASANKFALLAGAEGILKVSSALKIIGCTLFKMANDIRWMGSGPRAGLNECILPSNEPGSSIMPGKVNPTQCEALTMVVAQIIGNDSAITFGASQGNFELNVYRPLFAYNLLQSIELLSGAASSFSQHCLLGLQFNEEQIASYIENSLMVVTALNPLIGYDKAATIAKKAYLERQTLKQATLALGYLTEEEFDRAMDLRKMVHPNQKK